MIGFMMEQKFAAVNTFQQTRWRNRYTWSRGHSRTMIDFSLPDAHVKMALRIKTQVRQVEHAKRTQNNTTEVAGDERGKEKAKMDTTTKEGGE